MGNEQEYIETLIVRFLQGSLSAIEAELLENWKKASPGNALFFERVTDRHALLEKLQQFHRHDVESEWAALQERISGSDRASRALPARLSWLKLAAAAILLLAAGYAVFTMVRPKQSPVIVQTEGLPVGPIVPGTQKAFITLADGSTITLDSTTSGTLAQQGNAAIVKLPGGAIAYRPELTGAGHEMINTVRTPNGGIYQLTLSDGTQVWLNAASSITFPATFGDGERAVRITGEVYFEVAKSAGRPFIVQAGDRQRVEVLGTHFNISAYPDGGNIKTTLLEGAVRVSGPGNTLRLKPGQQAVSEAASGSINVVAVADMAQVLAWKNGLFIFDGSPLERTMQEIARWYDVDIVYEGPAPAVNFRGSIPRQEGIAQVLEMLSMTQAVAFRMEGRKVIVTAGKDRP